MTSLIKNYNILTNDKKDYLFTNKYPHIAVIKTFTNKNLICRLNFSKVTVNDIINNLKNNLGYKLKNFDLNKINFKSLLNKKICESKDIPLANLFELKKITEFSMVFDEHTTNNEFENYATPKDLLDKINKSSKCIFIKSLTGKTTTLRFVEEMKIIDLMYLIMDKEGTPYTQQRLVFKGSQLNVEQKMSDYNIQNESTIHLVLRLRGGMYHETSGKDGNYKKLTNCIININHISDDKDEDEDSDENNEDKTDIDKQNC